MVAAAAMIPDRERGIKMKKKNLVHENKRDEAFPIAVRVLQPSYSSAHTRTALKYFAVRPQPAVTSRFLLSFFRVRKSSLPVTKIYRVLHYGCACHCVLIISRILI